MNCNHTHAEKFIRNVIQNVIRDVIRDVIWDGNPAPAKSEIHPKAGWLSNPAVLNKFITISIISQSGE